MSLENSILANQVSSELVKTAHNACVYVKKSRFHQCDDSALLFIKKDYSLIGVFDGVSGQENAGMASENALKAVAAYIERNFQNKNLPDLLEGAIEDANYAVQLGGTTASIALILPDGIYSFANIGDSHIYKITEELITRLTVDERDASSFSIYTKSRNYVNQCLGSIIKKIDSGKGKLKDGEFLMAVTDGITDNLSIKIEGGFITDTSGKSDLKQILHNKNNPKNMLLGLAEEIKRRMQLKEEVIDTCGILVPKEDDASIVLFKYI